MVKCAWMHLALVSADCVAGVALGANTSSDVVDRPAPLRKAAGVASEPASSPVLVTADVMVDGSTTVGDGSTAVAAALVLRLNWCVIAPNDNTASAPANPPSIATINITLAMSPKATLGLTCSACNAKTATESAIIKEVNMAILLPTVTPARSTARVLMEEACEGAQCCKQLKTRLAKNNLSRIHAREARATL